MFDQDIWSGRMSAEVSQAPEKADKVKTSELCWKSWQGLSKKESQFLDLRRGSGTPQESSSVMGGQLLGESRMPNIGAYLNVEEGLHSLLTSEDTMHLALFLENTNPTEAPCEEIPSHLSDILEESPDPKYTLSAKACLGILTRASRRGKKLPPMLEEALIQNVVEETEYGQKGIADTIEILREMRREIGEEDLKEWVQRVFVLVQSEDVLLGEMCESCEDSEDSDEQVLVEGDGEESNREECLCDLWSNGEIGDTSQRREPNEQLSEQLNLLMQKLSHENAQKAVILYCLRIACEGEESMSEALSAASEGQDIGADDCIGKSFTLKIRSGCEGGGKGALIQTEKSATLSTLQDQTLFQPIIALDRASYNQGKNAQFYFEVSDKGINSPLVAKGPGAVCYTIDEKCANTYVWEEQANTLAARDYKQPQTVVAVDCRNGTEDAVNGALQSNAAHSLNGNNVVRTRYIVRRLTPLECERLQGYPDGWTDIGEWTDSNGKKRQTSDAARYKALGNSIALPPWKWVLKRLCACYERDATMASLFDGIAGFPYLWEQLNGKGSCLWASEIEEFPIAVTKKRIGE